MYLLMAGISLQENVTRITTTAVHLWNLRLLLCTRLMDNKAGS